MSKLKGAACAGLMILTIAAGTGGYIADAEPYTIAPPEVDYSGLKQQIIYDVPTAPVSYEMYYTEQDVIAVAQMLWGEARGCTEADKRNCVITVCNRCDDRRWPDTPAEVVSQYYQYLGYSPYNPVDEELYALALEVLTDWSLMKQGVECEWYGYNSFYGDGVRNHFYEV